jgi:hypothetical protein
MTIQFSEYNIQRLFGHEAAEDEDPARLREYYFKSSTYNQVVTGGLPLRILVGHKGIGKSALFQIAMAEDSEAHRLTLSIKPDDILGIAEDTSDFLNVIRAWKAGLTELLASKALTGLGVADEGWRDRFKSYGGRLVDFLRYTLESPLSYANLAATNTAIAKHFLATSEITIYIDDLDRGWQGRKQDITRISTLLNAVRDITNDNRSLRFRIALRSDVYFLVRTSDESTDKTEGSVIWQSWTNHEIFALLIKRINTFLNMSPGTTRRTDDALKDLSQDTLATYLGPVFELRFLGMGHWSNIPTHRMMLSLIRKRPRDLVKLCTLAGRDAQASGDHMIGTKNFNRILESYSQGRLQDTINEFKSELPDIERLLFGMRPAKRERTTHQGYFYTTTGLFSKIGNIQEQGTFTFSSGRVADSKDLAAFLYKINFITARKDAGEFAERKYFEESRYLQSRFADFGYDWEIHPAYRWALQPDEFLSIFLQIKPSSE